MKILVATGASAGHIFPALSFLEELKAKSPDIETLLILPRSSRERRSLDALALCASNIKYISLSNIRLSLDLKNILTILRFFKGSLESIFILFNFQPDIVVGFGTLVSLPIIFFAWVFRIKTLLHEQNVIPGRANMLLAKIADRIAVSFLKTEDYLKVSKNKIVLTGNPLRQSLAPVPKAQALEFFQFSQNKFTILVMGGSLGSHSINNIFFKSLSLLSCRARLQVIHLAGLKDYELLRDDYKGLDIDVRLYDFLKEVQYAYVASDLIICRAGAMTISELINFEAPAIIIPYPFACAHQLANAKVLEEAGCAIIIEEKNLSVQVLQQNIELFLNNPDKLKNMHASYHCFPQNHAADLLVDAALSLGSS
ncbi:MAG: UDP-N-acetylglucosamine--N-acetylmuramyl-(pentapeptide) pyrophosphoryl-undecaprenol N-acetylglucosamine transferase [Candidatus Omnitrophica bacterium]|nr:UDP-N-acetylglucosamine--N-acetylmuramyl-(pentapeptide) pyrophosphoryl-undecaprenol N-acetylglucosamine transferase [Candidatus Omnitrophota bacterium]